MTEFGKGKLLTAHELDDLGMNIVIYPVTLLRLAMGAAVAGLDEILATGTQEGVLDRMQTRAELYDLLDYSSYNRFDEGVFNFRL
jgi:methylisocitrate lyase